MQMKERKLGFHVDIVVILDQMIRQYFGLGICAKIWIFIIVKLNS